MASETPRLQPLLIEAAQLIGATVEEAPPQWLGSRFNAEVLSEALLQQPIHRHESELPDSAGAARLDTIPVLFGELSGSPRRRSAEEKIRRYRNQATIARSWLGSEAPNLQLFLVGPPGALSDPRWRQLAAEIEADDRVCRKLVWLYDQEPSIADAQRFLERTFVARPWSEASRSATQLDTMSDINLPPGWEAAIDDRELDNDGLVQRLIALEQGDAE
jgi:hypothetical protein